MFDDDARPKPPIGHVIGMDLSALSVGELEERVFLLRQEIQRIETELEVKGTTRAAAEGLFSRG